MGQIIEIKPDSNNQSAHSVREEHGGQCADGGHDHLPGADQRRRPVAAIAVAATVGLEGVGGGVLAHRHRGDHAVELELVSGGGWGYFRWGGKEDLPCTGWPDRSAWRAAGPGPPT